MTKNKIKALLLAICIALPSMFAFTACGHKHSYSDDWSYDASNHWHACTGKECDETKDGAAHTISYTKTATTHQAKCSVCGYEAEAVAHTYVTKHDDTQYWQECSVCGYAQEKVTGTVTEDEWKSALNFEGVTNFHYINYANYTVREIKASETAASLVITNVSNGSLRDKKIYVVEGTDASEAVYKYTYTKANESDLSKDVWKKESVSIVKDKLFDLVNPKNNLSSILNSIESFDYDAETGTYVSKSDATGLKFSSTNLLSLKLKFANAKLVWCEYTLDMANVQPEYCVISYDETEVELPNLSAVSAEEWQRALSFDGLNNYTMEKTSTNSSASTEKISVTATSLKREVTTSGSTSTSIFDTEREERYAKTGSEEKYTRYEFNHSMDTLLGLSALSGAPANYVLPLINSFDSAEYKADEQIYYIQQAKILGSWVQDVKLTFNNRRLVKLEYDTTSGGRFTNTITYTYNNTTIALPTASETVTYVHHNSSFNSFYYKGVSLSAGENVFEIEISDDKYASNKIGGVYMLGGTFSVSSGSATISSITAKNASGTTITNEATDVTGLNNMIFKNLSAGKYYITITVSADCTGNFNLPFKNAVSVPYSTGFSLENVNLSSGDNWFVVEISDATHSDKKVEGSSTYSLTGKFTLTDESSTNLTITAKSSTDANVANSAKTGVGAVNGAMLFKTLTEGKYYICVNASAACTGDFSLSFALKNM